MMKLLRRWTSLLLAVAVSGWLGCGASPANDVPGNISGMQYLLDQEPSGAVGVDEARQAAGQPQQMVVVGRISGGDQDSPWNDGHASFLISDPAAALMQEHHAEGDGHDHDNCPFCQRQREAQKLTIVQFLDSGGQVLPVDARRLLGVEEGQLVVVRGRGSLDGLGNLVVAADGIYIRR